MQVLLHDPDRERWLRFADPLDVVTVTDTSGVLPALASIEQRVERDGLYAAGYLSYEAAGGFDPALRTQPPGALPLLAFALYRAPATVAAPTFEADPETAALDWSLDTDRATHARQVAAIREQIANGNCYQVNLTLRATAGGVDGWQLFRLMAADMPYATWIETDELQVACASPELFLQRDGSRLVSRPMKGTARRGLSAAEDVQQRELLAGSAKDRAENIMIADMIRNDLGRVADPGSVRADALFTMEKYPTVWQATSTITATSHASLVDILAATFPCASITGAPKVAAMQRIRDLEASPRGIYTGSTGWLGPGGQAQLNVAIRTATVDRRTRRAVYGVGGGIVWDSSPDAEFDECLAKARILRRRWPRGRFRLLETLRFDGDFALLDRHLDRLRASADYFDFRLDLPALRDALATAADGFGDAALRVRLLLASDGSVDIETAPLPAPAEPVRLRLAREPVERDDVRLYHKTTSREIYEDARRQVDDCDDVVLWNRDEELTETTIANLALLIGGKWLTPPVSCGLLPGTLRAELLARGELEERVLPVAALETAEAIEVVNALRGRRRAVLA